VRERFPGMKPNRLRQAENLSRFSGFWHNAYYENGVKHPGGERIDDQHVMIQGQEYYLPHRTKRERRTPRG